MTRHYPVRYCSRLVEANFTSGTTNQKQYPHLGSDISSVWNFCACFSDVISWGNRWWHCKCHLFSLTTIPDKNTRLIVNVSQETAVINRKSKNNLPESVFSHNYQPLRQKRHQIVVNNPIVMLSFSLGVEVVS